MKNLESILAENMRRFNTKNLTEDQNLNAAADFSIAIMPRLQPGYNYETIFNTSINKREGTSNFWKNVHLLVPTSKTFAIASGFMAPPPPRGVAISATTLKYAPMFSIITTADENVLVPLGALTMETLLGTVMGRLDVAAVDQGLRTFIQQVKVPQPAQPLTAQSLQAIATKYKVVQQYNSMSTSLMAALGIK